MTTDELRDWHARFDGTFQYSGNGCMVWKRCRAAGGYGYVRFRGKQWKAHRLSYSLSKGPIPIKMCVCHKCDNPGCINPDHLFLGTVSENNGDRSRKKRCAYGPRNGMNRYTRFSDSAVIDAVKVYYKLGSFAEASRSTGISPYTINQWVRGYARSHVVGDLISYTPKQLAKLAKEAMNAQPR